MKPSHLREMYYKKECRRVFSKFTLFIYNLFPEQLSEIQNDPNVNMFAFNVTVKWLEIIRHHDVGAFIYKYCDIEKMSQYTDKVRLFKLKKRYSLSQD